MRSLFVLGLVSIGGEYSSLYLYRRTAHSFKLMVFVPEMCSRDLETRRVTQQRR